MTQETTTTELNRVIDFLNHRLKTLWFEDSFEWSFFINSRVNKLPPRVWANIIGDTYTLREQFKYLQRFSQKRIELLILYWMIALGNFAKHSLNKENIVEFSKDFLRFSFEDFNVMCDTDNDTDNDTKTSP